jgi:DNA-binding response OmpR family regulator
MKKLLLVEDNVDMALAVIKYFMKHDYHVDHYSSFEKALPNIKKEKYLCYILDINLPRSSGFQGAEIIRRTDKDTPLVAITARDAIEDKLKGFDSGFNDYVVKPFDLRELLARVETHIRQRSSEEVDIITQDFNINYEKYVASYKGKQLDLTNIEFRILYQLLKNANLLVKTDDLIEDAWGNDPDAFNPPVRMHISNLRRKINDDDYTIIETIPGIGYKLNT